MTLGKGVLATAFFMKNNIAGPLELIPLTFGRRTEEVQQRPATLLIVSVRPDSTARKRWSVHDTSPSFQSRRHTALDRRVGTATAPDEPTGTAAAIPGSS